MKWSEVRGKHHGRKVRVWTASTPKNPHDGESYEGRIRCAGDNIVPLLDVYENGYAGVRYFQNWWNVDFIDTPNYITSAQPPVRLTPVEPTATYDRQVLVEVLTYHWPDSISGCTCGWAELGKAFPEHVANVYEASVIARNEEKAKG